MFRDFLNQPELRYDFLTLNIYKGKQQPGFKVLKFCPCFLQVNLEVTLS